MLLYKTGGGGTTNVSQCVFDVNRQKSSYNCWILKLESLLWNTLYAYIEKNY